MVAVEPVAAAVQPVAPELYFEADKVAAATRSCFHHTDQHHRFELEWPAFERRSVKPSFLTIVMVACSHPAASLDTWSLDTASLLQKKPEPPEKPPGHLEYKR